MPLEGCKKLSDSPSMPTRDDGENQHAWWLPKVDLLQLQVLLDTWQKVGVFFKSVLSFVSNNLHHPSACMTEAHFSIQGHDLHTSWQYGDTITLSLADNQIMRIEHGFADFAHFLNMISGNQEYRVLSTL